MLYPLTFYTKTLPPNVGGVAQGPIIRILEKYRGDVGIYKHELTHVKQWFLTLGIHSILYLFSRKYRLWSEVEAFREQSKHYPDDRKPLFASYIANGYKLSVSTDEVLKLLRK
jgi:hypothetical protein